MESKKDLDKIGQEGFALLDEYYSRKGKSSAPPKPPTPKTSPASQVSRMHTFVYQYQPQKPNVYQINPVSRTEKMVIQNQEAKTDLLRIGLEGFSLMDEYYGKKPGPLSSFAPQKPPVSSRPVAIQGRRAKQTRYYQSQPEKPNVNQVKPAYATEENVMNAYEAAKLYGGVLIIDRSI